jgi:hypothetical protein
LKTFSVTIHRDQTKYLTKDWPDLRERLLDKEKLMKFFSPPKAEEPENDEENKEGDDKEPKGVPREEIKVETNNPITKLEAAFGRNMKTSNTKTGMTCTHLFFQGDYEFIDCQNILFSLWSENYENPLKTKYIIGVGIVSVL